MNRWLNWWRARPRRERRLLLLAVFITAAALLYQGWRQAAAYEEEARQALVQEHQALMSLPALEAALAKRVGRPQPGVPLLTELMALARESGLTLTLESRGQNTVLAGPADVDFQLLLTWLAGIESRWQLRASKLFVERTGEQVQLRSLELTPSSEVRSQVDRHEG
jgi:type II secretory pathway component PulM